MMKRKLLTTLLVFVLAVVFALSFVFAACGTTKPNTPNEPDNPTPSEPKATYTIDWQTGDTTLTADGYSELPTSAEEDTQISFIVSSGIDYGYSANVTVNGNNIDDNEGKYSFTVTQDTTVTVTVVMDTADFQEVKLHEYFTEGLPKIYIDTENGINIDDPSLVNQDEHKGLYGEIAVYNYVGATVRVEDEKYPLSSSAAKVKVRGNYSSTYPKRPLRIKFDKKQAMCGLNNGNKLKNWVLLAEYKDSSLMRNSIADYLGNTILESDGYYCTDFRYVEVYLNNNYNGLYLLCEQQEVKSDRVDIAEALDPEDKDNIGKTEAELKNTKIGYLIEYDGYYMNEAEEERFAINQNGTQGYSISSDVYYTEQREYIKTCMQSIWDIATDALEKSKRASGQTFYTLNEDTGAMVADPTIKSAREAIEKVIDVRSLVDMFILQEICLDMDISWSSFYMSLDMSETGSHKLTFTAPWDFDSAVGNSIEETDKFQSLDILHKGNGDGVTANPWLALLAQQDWFWASVNTKWDMLEEAGAFTGVSKMIDDYLVAYEDAFNKNMQKWTECLGKREDQQNNLAVNHPNQASSARYVQKWVNERITNLGKLIDAKVAEFGLTQ